MCVFRGHAVVAAVVIPFVWPMACMLKFPDGIGHKHQQLTGLEEATNSRKLTAE